MSSIAHEPDLRLLLIDVAGEPVGETSLPWAPSYLQIDSRVFALQPREEGEGDFPIRYREVGFYRVSPARLRVVARKEPGAA